MHARVQTHLMYTDIQVILTHSYILVDVCLTVVVDSRWMGEGREVRAARGEGAPDSRTVTNLIHPPPRLLGVGVGGWGLFGQPALSHLSQGRSSNLVFNFRRGPFCFN